MAGSVVGIVRSRMATAAEVDQRIVDAALACVARVGVTKTTLDDVASEAGCSRATVYRYFPGKAQLLRTVVRVEVERLDAALCAATSGTTTLGDTVIALMVTAADQFTESAALQFVLAYEPEVILPHLSFARADGLLASAADIVAPHLRPYLPDDVARRAGEWLCRITMSYLCNPSEGIALTDIDDVSRLVHDFVLPGLEPSP
jgi:AcrR family transcriptional regulator